LNVFCQYSEEDARNNMLLRRLLGLGIIVLTVLVAILIAWRLPLRRNVDDPVRWGIPREYYEYQRHAPETVNDLNKEKNRAWHRNRSRPRRGLTVLQDRKRRVCFGCS